LRASPRESLEEREAHFRFLSELGEATGDLAEPELILATAARRLGQHLRASRCAYAEVEPDADHFTIRHDYTVDCASTAGEYQLSLFGRRAASQQRAGQTLIVHDVDRELTPEDGGEMFSAISVKAIVCCPLLRAGRLVAMMAVHQVVPRQWTPHEVALIEAVVERCWAYIERARATRALSDSEAKLQQLADAMPQIVWTARPDGVLDYYNRRWFEYIDVPPSGGRDIAWDHYIHPDDLGPAYERWSQSLRTGDDYVIEFRVRRSDGMYRWFLVRALPARDDQGRIARWFGTCTDIHDSKLADEALLRGRAQMQLVVKGADVGVWYCPLPFDKLVWDDKVKEHFHLPPSAEVDIGLFYERIHPEDRARTQHAIEASIAQRTAYEIDYRTVSPDGQHIKWVRAIGRGYYDEHGAPQRFDGVTIDVTKRTEAELALRESELRFRHMSDSAPVMIWVTRADGYCEYLNQRWYEFTGQTPAIAVGFGWLSAVHEADAERAAETFARCNAAREMFTIEYRLRRRDGAYRWCVDSATPRFGPTGEYLGYIGSVIDITDRAVAEQERAALLESERAARIEAERASRMKDEFLATLSHELRTPLNAILGWAHLSLSRRQTPEQLTKGLTIIERNARAQAQIIEDLLDMSRIVSGKIRLDVGRVELAGIVLSAVETARPAADAKGLELLTELEAADDLTFSGDANRLHQVLWNLLSNAVKFTPKGGRVQVSLARRDQQLELRVADTGEGIAAEFLPFVFDRFRQADASSTRRHGGLGLGLAIVKQLVELHGGTVQVASDGPGRGTTFVVTLPVTGELRSSSESLPARLTTRGAQPELAFDDEHGTLTGLRVLVVDDELDARALIKQLLDDQRAVVTMAASAHEAYVLLTQQRFDVLLSDIGMPHEDGYGLIRRVRALGKQHGGDLPAVALTAYARTEDRIRALQAGYQMHLVKPVEPTELLTVVASLAARRAPRAP
jgi:PAS domain S-box-containing protein